MIQSKALRQSLYVLLWFIHDKSGEYKLHSYLPKHEVEAIVRTFYPSVVTFFESEEGKQEFEAWRNKKATKDTKKHETVIPV